MADVYLQHKRTCTVLRRKKSENKMRGACISVYSDMIVPFADGERDTNDRLA